MTGRARTYPEHGEVVVALFHGVIDSVDEARIVLAALRNVVCAGARRSRHVVAHDLGNELLGLVAAVVQRLVCVGVGLHDQVDVGLQGGQLGPVVAVSVVREGAHHVGQLLGQHVAPFIAFRGLRLRRRGRVPQREVVRGGRTAVSHHGRAWSASCVCGGEPAGGAGGGGWCSGKCSNTRGRPPDGLPLLSR